MTSIIIAGRPNSEEMSECILVAENISNMYPSSRFTVVLKSPKEWEKYCEDLCNLFGILKKTHPLILFSNGKKIGGAQDFFKLISDSFKYDKLIKKNDEYIFDIDPSEVTKLTKENTLLVEKEYTCRTSGIYIIDKINQKLEEIPDKKFIENYNKYNTIETDYESDLIEDMKVYVKYDNKFTPSPQDYKEYTEIIEERPAYADKEKYNAYHEELRLKKEEEERLKKEAEEEEKRKKEEEERLKEEALKAEEEKNDTEGNTTNRKNKEKKKKEEEKRKKEEERKKKEEEERKKKEEEEKKRKEEEEQKKKEEEEAKKKEEETLKTETENQQNTESQKEKEEPVPEVKEIKYKRIFFKCYTDFDIPYEKFDKELIVENFNTFNFQLVINPYFTFFGETIINKIKDYQAPLLPEREEPVVEEDEPPQLTTISAIPDPNVTKDNKDKTNPNKTTESFKDKKNIKNDDKKEKETPQNTVSGSNSFRKDEKKPQTNANTNNNNVNNNQQNDNKNNNNNNNAQPAQTEKPQTPEIKYKGPTQSTEPNTYKPNFTEEKMPKDVLVIKDYGRLPSLRLINFGGEDLRFYQEYIPPYQLSEHIRNSSNLFNFNKDVNIIDDNTLYSLIEMVNETDGYVTYRVLPYNYTDWKKFGSNTFKILPNKSRDIKNEDYPLVDKIKQMINKFKRQLFNKSIENIEKDDPKNVELILHNDDFDQCFPPPEFFVIDVYLKHGIQHLVKTFTPGTFISVNVKFAINKICEKLEINNTTGYGFCLVLCKKFVFIAPLKEPYTYTKGEVNDKKEQISPRIPIFAEPYYFMGIFTLPYIESEWPESIKRKNVKFDLVDILKKSTN